MNASGITQVIESVRTPLALAALVLLLGAALLRQILTRKGHPNEDTKAIVRYGFILGLVFGVLAIGSFVYSESINREIRISGIVEDESGAGIPNASVRIAGRGGGVADAEGNVAFTIPASRAARDYSMQVSAPSYQMAEIALKGRDPQPFTVVLKKQAVSVANALALPAEMTVLHWLGVPEIWLPLTFTNPFPDTTKVTDITISVVPPSGSTILLTMNAIMVPGQLPQPPLPLLSLNKGDQITFIYDFFDGDSTFQVILQKVGQEVAPKQSTYLYPDPKANILSPSLVKELRSYTD